MTYHDFSPTGTIYATHPTWTCQICLRSVDTGGGFLGIKYADIRAIEPGQTQDIHWHTLCGSCADQHDRPDGISDNWYMISTLQLRTWGMVGRVACYLAEKWWFEYSDWFTAIHRAVDGEQ